MAELKIMIPEGLGDPTPIGWGVFFLYFVVAWLCCRARLKIHAEDPLATLWLVTAGGLFLLGVNKQLDIQLWVGAIGRWLTSVLGWYEQRFWVQLLFAIAVSSLLIGCSFIVWRLAWAHLRRIPVATLGMVVLVVFVLMRVATFDVVDLEIEIGDTFVHELLEIAGIVLIGVAAVNFPESPERDLTEPSTGLSI